MSTSALSSALKETLAVIEQSDVPENLVVTAFTEVLRFKIRELSSGTPIGGSPSSDASTEPDRLSDDGMMGKLSRRLSISPEEIAHIYYVDEGEIRLSVLASQLGSTKAQRSQRMAVLLLAGRQGSGLEDVTSQALVRAHAEAVKVCDPKNFSSTIGKMSDRITFRGSGPQRGLVLKAKGFDEASALITEILSLPRS